ncbi:MAG: hypothetical protein EOO01_41050, partial [Chitinophagaceae bacterium]
MNKKIFIAILLVVFQLSCDKKGGDFTGEEKLRGRLTYGDIYSGDGLVKPVAGKKVYLAYSPSDTLNYLYSDTTDADGYFSFENVAGGKGYDLFFSDSLNGIRYTAFKNVTPPNTTIDLLAGNDSIGQNGMYIETRLNGQLLANTDICVFNNQALFNADTCAGSNRSAPSDQSGRKIFYNFLPGTYYLRAYKRIGNDLYMATDTRQVARTGIPRIIFNLQKIETIVNALTVQVQDASLLPVSSIKVGIYTNRAAFAVDTAINASLKSGNTGADGKIQFSNINGGYYYIRAYMTIGNT